MNNESKKLEEAASIIPLFHYSGNRVVKCLFGNPLLLTICGSFNILKYIRRFYHGRTKNG
jgi:hypothetical protein